MHVGYTAGYAVHVHEDLASLHKPGKQAKFLEEPLRTKIEPKLAEFIKDAIIEMGGTLPKGI